MGARFSAAVQTDPGDHTASCTIGTGSFPAVKSGRGVTLSPHPLLMPWSKKGLSYNFAPPMGRTACTESQCLYKGALYLTLPIFSENLGSPKLLTDYVVRKLNIWEICFIVFWLTL